MLLQIGGYGQFSAIEGGVTDPVNTFVSEYFQGDEIAIRTRHDDLCVDNFHESEPLSEPCSMLKQ